MLASVTSNAVSSAARIVDLSKSEIANAPASNIERESFDTPFSKGKQMLEGKQAGKAENVHRMHGDDGSLCFGSKPLKLAKFALQSVAHTEERLSQAQSSCPNAFDLLPSNRVTAHEDQ